MRTCSLCHSPSPDQASTCAQCGADLAAYSETAVALARLRTSPRVGRVRLLVAADACPACLAAEGEYRPEAVPALPVPGCSHATGCRCFYAPALTDIFP